MAADFDAVDVAEFEALSWAIVQRLREGSLPPDEAYWWARILGEDARALLNPPAGMPPVGFNPPKLKVRT